MDIVKERLHEMIDQVEQIYVCNLDMVDHSEINNYKNMCVYIYKRCPHCGTVTWKGSHCRHCREKNETLNISYEVLQRAKQNYANYFDLNIEYVRDEHVIQSSAGVLGWY